MKISKIGFIGLGRMGNHMAARLLRAGYEVLVFDTERSCIDLLVEQGALSCSSTLAMAQEVATILLSLPTPGVVEDVVLGADGLINGTALRTVIDLSTTGPSVSASVGRLLREKSIELIDAPVSGGVTGAKTGSLSLMVSGDTDSFEAAKPILEAIGSKIFYLGTENGRGQWMKIINNMLCAAAAVSACEALVLGAKAGLDPKTMLDVINASSGRSFATEVKIPECILDRSFPLRFSTELLHKDVTLCTQEAERLGVPMWINQSVKQFLALAMAQGLGRADYARIITMIEGWAGTEFGSATRQKSVVGENT
jgi:3-hydroxyisobutyrate dehydrogenase